MQDQIKQYIDIIISPLVRGGYDIIPKQDDLGWTFIITAKIEQEYEVLIGKGGLMAKSLRYLVKQYAFVNFKGLNVNVFIPDPKYESKYGKK
jgi:predicted RNA-binding protein YlqC (UPF0109 family)